jgi:hypothetical protein
VTQDAPVKTIPNADPKEAIDAVVAKIVKEKQSGSVCFDDTGGAHGRTFDDDDQVD